MLQDLIDKRKKLMKEFKEFRSKSQQAFKNKCKKFPQCEPSPPAHQLGCCGVVVVPYLAKHAWNVLCRCCAACVCVWDHRVVYHWHGAFSQCCKV